jgi:hypothetical protein
MHAKLNDPVISRYNAQSDIQYNLTPVREGDGKVYLNSLTYLAPTEEFFKYRLTSLSINSWYCAPDEKAAASHTHTHREHYRAVYSYTESSDALCHRAQFILPCVTNVWTRYNTKFKVYIYIRHKQQ